MSPTERQLSVAVCGAGVANDRDTAVAEAVGRLLARAGAIVVCGGLGGVMAAAVRGASSEGGLSIGLLPGETRAGAAEGLTVALPTGLGEGRNILVVRAADAVIAVGGEFGTLTEIAFALKIGVPVIGLDTWELSKRGNAVEAFPSVTTPEEAVTRALEAARARGLRG
jgi:uncharacterized protein (TIGR00725 family)